MNPMMQQGNFGYLTQQPQPQNTWYAGYLQQVQQQEIMQFQAWFGAIDRDRGGTITAQELTALQFGGRNLSFSTARRLVMTFDKDRNGNLGFWEYVCMHKFIMQCQQAFLTGDQDRSGQLNYMEIFTALQVSGFQASQQTVQKLIEKFDADRSMQLSFDEYLAVAAHLAHLRSLFEWNDQQRTGMIHLNFDQLALISSDLL